MHQTLYCMLYLYVSEGLAVFWIGFLDSQPAFILLCQEQIWHKKIYQINLGCQILGARKEFLFVSYLIVETLQNTKPTKFFCFTPMKISPNLYCRMDGSKFWGFPWFPESSLQIYGGDFAKFCGLLRINELWWFY